MSFATKKKNQNHDSHPFSGLLDFQDQLNTLFISLTQLFSYWHLSTCLLFLLENVLQQMA